MTVPGGAAHSLQWLPCTLNLQDVASPALQAPSPCSSIVDEFKYLLQLGMFDGPITIQEEHACC